MASLGICLFVPALTIALTSGCGGSAFTSGGDPGADASAADGGDASAESGVEGGGAVDAAPPPQQAISCGAGAGAPGCARTCCVVKSGGGFDYHCEDGVTCGASGGAGLRCNQSGDCRPTEVCCISKVNNAVFSRCATSCGAGDGQLCAEPIDPKCAPTAPCSSNNIGNWGLPGTYATCGGVQPP